LREELPLVTSVAILLITSLILKKNWYDHLKKEDEGVIPLSEVDSPNKVEVI
jgi:hypothetical protein